ncbi:MAG: helix-turn-helix domain protein, partial [Blastococcus sp.]|nr:helix-turn-helix domain protein [Blastococcus sp.]
SIRAEDLKSLAIIYDMSPDELTTRLIEWGVLSPGMESVVGFGGPDEDDEELDPNWERRRAPR